MQTFLSQVWDSLQQESGEDAQKKTANQIALNRLHNEANKFLSIPSDVLFLIFSLCEQRQDLLEMRRVCRRLGLKELHVRSRFWKIWCEQSLGRHVWQSFSVNGAPAEAGRMQVAVRRLLQKALAVEEEPLLDDRWFRMALENAAENQRAVEARGGDSANAGRAWAVEGGSVLQRLLPSSSSCFVPIFGNALETSARRLVYRLMWGSAEAPPLFQVQGVFPGTGGMGGGVAFHVGRKTLKVAPFYSWSKTLELGPVLLEAMRACHGLVFVVDDKMLDVETERTEMAEMLNKILEVSAAMVPILVLNFCDAEGRHTHNPKTVISLLGFDIESTKRVISVRNVVEGTDQGVGEGFLWLSEVIP
jgi:hypothetical protein